LGLSGSALGNPLQLKIFREVARAGSLAGAVRLLGWTRPAPREAATVVRFDPDWRAAPLRRLDAEIGFVQDRWQLNAAGSAARRHPHPPDGPPPPAPELVEEVLEEAWARRAPARLRRERESS
jgi:hypothetical protein